MNIKLRCQRFIFQKFIRERNSRTFKSELEQRLNRDCRSVFQIRVFYSINKMNVVYSDKCLTGDPFYPWSCPSEDCKKVKNTSRKGVTRNDCILTGSIYRKGLKI